MMIDNKDEDIEANKELVLFHTDIAQWEMNQSWTA